MTLNPEVIDYLASYSELDLVDACNFPLTDIRNPASPELEKVLARLDSEDSLQRRNGLDVLTELVAVTTKSTETVDTPLRFLSCLDHNFGFSDRTVCRI